MPGSCCSPSCRRTGCPCRWCPPGTQTTTPCRDGCCSVSLVAVWSRPKQHYNQADIRHRHNASLMAGVGVPAANPKVSRVRHLPPRVQTVGGFVSVLSATPGSWRAEKQNGRGRFYDTREWRDRIRPGKLRMSPLCEDCLERDHPVAATEVDHVDGDARNNEPRNLRSLCKPCHSVKTAREDGSFGREKR